MKSSEIRYTDEELVLRLQDDDEEAFRLIYDRYWSALFGNAFNRIKDKEVAQDVVQEVFLDIWRRRRSLRMESLPAYLHTAVRFMTYRRLSEMPLNSDYYREFEQTLVSSYFAEDSLLHNELWGLLDKWILALPKKRRQIFLMHFDEDLSTEEIAARLGVARKTVQNQLTTAYAEIQKKYAHFLSTILIGLISWSGLFLSIC